MTNKQLSDLLASMNTEEKLAQLTQLTPACLGFDCITPLTGPDSGLRVSSTAARSVGSVLNCDNASQMREIQKKHLEEDPHRIPLLFMADIIHGFKTIFPIPLAAGCSFSAANLEEAASISALEGSASGIHVTFSPMADLVRDPRWGRVMESFGEDPLLNSRLCAAAVSGYQGADLSAPHHMASCVKHFAAYGAPEGGRDYNTVDLSAGMMRDTYLPAYRAALDAGARMVMSSFNIVDRVPATANTMLLEDILRKEWAFQGIVISDYNSVGELLNHGVAADGSEAARKSLTAGIDIEMMSTHFLDSGRQLLEENQLSPPALDAAVLRVLNLKNELGLFEDPYKDADPEKEKELHLSARHRAAARRIAGESAVLLKNEQALPISGERKIGLAGPFACSPHVLGGWSAGSEEGVSLYDGLLGKMPSSSLCLGAADELGSWMDGKPDIPYPSPSLLECFDGCDTVIAALGESQTDTGEGASKAYLRLSPNQEALVRLLKASGKTVVAVIFSGRPLELLPILPDCDALLQAWFLGTESGNALADLLTGAANPSGRLCISFPCTVGQIPIYYNRFSTGRPVNEADAAARYASRYLDCPVEPLFCFGYGLSYSDFYYTDFSLSVKNGLAASVKVENRSAFTGTEIVQLYIRDLNAQVVRPVRELKDFRKITLAPGASQTVTFSIVKEMLSYYGTDQFLFEPGRFQILIGKNSNDSLSETLFIDESFV